MDNSKLLNAGLGSVIKEVNTDKECEEFFNGLMDMTVEEGFNYLLEEMPKFMRKLKFSTVFDILVHGEDLEEFANDPDLDEEDED